MVLQKRSKEKGFANHAFKNVINNRVLATPPRKSVINNRVLANWHGKHVLVVNNGVLVK